MKISNLNIQNLLRWTLLLLFVIILSDVFLSIFTDFLDPIFTGYSALVIPVLVVAAYAYVGLPIFVFDDRSKVLHLKSHLAFPRIFGKELYVLKKNVIKFEIDRKRVRKKLTIYYLKDGREFTETFSISLLSNKKIERLAQQLELIQSEIKEQGSYHLFI